MPKASKGVSCGTNPPSQNQQLELRHLGRTAGSTTNTARGCVPFFIKTSNLSSPFRFAAVLLRYVACGQRSLFSVLFRLSTLAAIDLS
jgi:hypothetical protein